jgi:S-adenosylmethionine:tRNA ribosyltransferase-isomerase
MGKEDDFRLSAYSYDLPPELVAQVPPEQRGGSRLMVLNRATGDIRTATFAELADFLPPSLLVANNSRVLPARVYGQKTNGAQVEFLLLTPLPWLHPQQEDNGVWTCRAQGLLRPAKRLREGDAVRFSPDFSLTALHKEEYGRTTVTLRWKGDLAAQFERHGHIPLPRYIHRPPSAQDRERYQTTYAQKEKNGSVAAPTAGLHFTEALRRELLAAGHKWAELTLYVGYGTFSPVRAEDIRDHAMHEECVEISPETAAAVTQAKRDGRAIVAVGTTVARALEGVCAVRGQVEAYKGGTNIFLRPGSQLQVVDKLITNFHLPGSSLIMLAAALAGRETILAAYAHAVEQRFNFFSYGDAMLIL